VTGVLSGRHVLIWLLGFFAVVMAANGAFVFFALRTHPGIESEDAYRKGLTFNRTIAAAERQNALGWKGAATYAGGTLRATIADAAGRPVTGLVAEVLFRRPVAEGNDVAAALTERAEGVYAAAVTLPLKGQWDVVIEARRRDGARFAFETRLRAD
jgi:nitrogen fixation protein FixH